MTISELIAELEKIRAEHGDVPVWWESRWESISHRLPPDLAIRTVGGLTFVLLNA